jgi:hypothetical protein
MVIDLLGMHISTTADELHIRRFWENDDWAG